MKTNFKRALAGVLMAGAVVASTVIPSQITRAEAATAPIYWGAYNDGVPWDGAKEDAFESRVGKKESIVHWGEPWKMGGSMMKFQSDMTEKVRLRGQIPMIDWNSWDLAHQADDPNFTLAKIYNGTYDAYITQWATDAKNWGHPFFLRFDHEMNGWWYVWSEQRNSNQPGDYVKAWRHVHDIFTRVGATNVTWVWCVNLEDAKSTPIAEMYPGDSYVDWTSIDGYNKATGTTDFFSFDSIFSAHPWSKKNTYGDVVALAPSKPVMIGETATSIKGGDTNKWIQDMFAVLPQKYPQVKALVWFNWDAGSGMGWPIETTAAQTAGFKAGVASSYYATNTFKDLPAGTVKPIGGTPSTTPPATPAPAPAPTGTVTLKNTGDTYVDASNPTSTAGGPSLNVYADGDPQVQGFLAFDLSSLAGKTVTSATLRVHVTNDTGAGSTGTFDIDLANGTVNGASTNWNNKPTLGTKVGSLVNPANLNTWYSAGISAAGVQTYTGKTLTLGIASTNSFWDGLIFNSKEGDQTVAPQLVISYK